MMEKTATASIQKPWYIAVDVGGTFTDLVIADKTGLTQVFKVPSVPDDPSKGVLSALEKAAEHFEQTLNQLLSGCQRLVHGSTIATNTMLEGKGATVGLLTTEGFRDSLEIRRGYREDQWDHRSPYPEVLVPRHLRLPVRGRIDRNGEETIPLRTSDLSQAVDYFKANNVQSVAICLINSFLNNAHEQTCAKVLRGLWNDVSLSISSEIVPIIGEYERSSTTVVNAYLGFRVISYLHSLDEQLRNLGLNHPTLLVQSNGGMISIDQISASPVNLVLSGPAAGVGAMNLCRQSTNSGNLISMEIGGTSCDVTLMSEGRVVISDALTIAGYHLAIPAVEIYTVGAGGGTIAKVDEAGLLIVGPHGAGAHPGPACYGLGGTEPTVTDAQLVLGRLRPGSYAGGSVHLDEALARKAIRHSIANPLKIGVDEAAIGIIRLLEQNLLQAAEQISIERGYDPRQFTLIAAGGAGPMHAATVGRSLGCAQIYIPRQAGVFCATGMLHSDIRRDYYQVHFADLDHWDDKWIKMVFNNLEKRAFADLAEEGFDQAKRRLERELDLRYQGQQWSIRVILDPKTALDSQAIRASFETEHARLFGHIQPNGIIEITSLRVIGIGMLDRLAPVTFKKEEAVVNAKEKREVFQNSQKGWMEAVVFSGEDLKPGFQSPGPLLVEEQTTTIFVGPEDLLEVDAANNYIIRFELPAKEIDDA